VIAAIQSRLSYANVAATVALILALGGGAYAAATFVAPNGQINACVDRKGRMTLVKATTKCPKGKRKIAWNQTGVPGASGPPGAPGAPGAPGTGVGGSEAWHEVGKSGEPAFVSGLSCNGGLHPCAWTNSRDSAFGLDDSDSTTTAFYRDPLGIVHLKGAPCVEDILTSDCESGLSVPFGGVAIFTLPTGYRPDHDWNFEVLGSNGGTGTDGRVSVHADGSVRVIRPNSVTWVTLDGITFRAVG
jgi:hypothetical protein